MQPMPARRSLDLLTSASPHAALPLWDSDEPWPISYRAVAMKSTLLFLTRKKIKRVCAVRPKIASLACSNMVRTREGPLVKHVEMCIDVLTVRSCVVRMCMSSRGWARPHGNTMFRPAAAVRNGIVPSVCFSECDAEKASIFVLLVSLAEMQSISVRFNHIFFLLGRSVNSLSSGASRTTAPATPFQGAFDSPGPNTVLKAAAGDGMFNCWANFSQACCSMTAKWNHWEQGD